MVYDEKEGRLILDSGASDHIFPSSDCMTGYSQLASPEYVYTPDNKAHEVKGSGFVTLAVQCGSEVVHRRLIALHVPSIEQQLVSMTRLNERGDVEFHLKVGGVSSLTRGGRKWCDVKRGHNGLLLLQGSIIQPRRMQVNLVQRMPEPLKPQPLPSPQIKEVEAQEPLPLPPTIPETPKSMNLKSKLGGLGRKTGYEILEELLGDSKAYGGARGQVLVRDRSRIRTGVITNSPHLLTSKPYAPPDLTADVCAVWCSGHGGVLADARGCGTDLIHVGYGRGHSCPSFFCGG